MEFYRFGWYGMSTCHINSQQRKIILSTTVTRSNTNILIIRYSSKNIPSSFNFNINRHKQHNTE